MGDRISIRFENTETCECESAVLFSQGDGELLKESVDDYIKDLKSKELSIKQLDPGTVMIDFLIWYLKDEERPIQSSYYLLPTEEDGDNSDNGHWNFDLGTEKWYRNIEDE